MAIVIDTGPLLAAMNVNDSAHDPCLSLLTTEEPLVIPDPVLVELDYWLRKLGAPTVWSRFSEQVSAGAFTLQPITPPLLAAAAELQGKYADLRIGFVDAAVFVTCEALGEDKIATLDHRHFSVLRTREGAALDILPAFE